MVYYMKRNKSLKLFAGKISNASGIFAKAECNKLFELHIAFQKLDLIINNHCSNMC